MAWVAPAVAAIGSAMGGTAAGTAAAGTAAGAAGAGTAAGLGAGTAAGLGSTAAGLGSTAAGTGAGTLGMAAGAGTAVPLATSAASTLPTAASSAGSSGLFDTVLGMGKDIAKDSLSSAAKSKLQQALSPTAATSPQMPQAQAPTGMDTAAAQNRPRSAGTGSFQANIGPGYQLGERDQAKIQGLSDEEAGLLQRVLSSTSGSIR